MRRWILLLGLLALCLPQAAAGAEPARITRNEATASFGAEVRFELEASADQPIVDVALLFTSGSDDADALATFVEATPIWQPGQSIKASFVRDVQVEYLPGGITLSYKWSITQQDGTVTETPVQSLEYNDTRFSWREKSDGLVTIRWYEGSDAWGDEILASTVGGLKRLEAQINTQITKPIVIMVYASTRDMRGALPPNSEEWIGGQARPELGLVIGAIREGDSAELARLVPHELSHLVLHQATDNLYGGMPVWFDEGLAVSNQDVRDQGFTQDVEQAAINGELIPLQALAANFPSDPQKALLSYAESESVVRYIVATYGDDAIAGLVAEFKKGSTDDMAVATVLNKSLDELDSEWRATLPALKRTPEIESNPQTAPANRFKNSPRQPSSASGSTPQAGATSSASLLSRIPLWLWFIGAAGVLLLAVGFIMLIRGNTRR